MQNIDRRARDKYGIPTLLLMENAAHGILRVIEDTFGPVTNRNITLICGKGNNGGDGLAAARLLHNRGARVQIFLLAKQEELKGDAQTNLDIALKMGIDVQGRGSRTGSYDIWSVRNAINHSHVIVDAIFGTGLSSQVKGEYLDIIELINNSNRPVVAVDIPTGINSDTGEIMGGAVRATATVTFGIPKRGHILYPGSDFTGKLHVVDISIPDAAIEEESIPLDMLTEDDMVRLLPHRLANSHKGSFGHVLVVAGSIGKGGAAAMTSLSCLKAGAGLVTLAAPVSVQPLIAGKLTEVMTYPLDETDEKTISLKAINTLSELSKDKEVSAIGPGLTINKDTAELTRQFIKEVTTPIVIDADAINALNGHLGILKERSSDTILTPHPGEMARLTGKTPSDVQKDRIGIAKDFAVSYGVYLVLKGAHTVIAEPTGVVHINPTGNPGMATAGTGDALTGIIAGFIAQGVDISSAVKLGVYIHGLAGDMAAEEVGMTGMLAGDLIERIPAAIRHLEQKKK